MATQQTKRQRFEVTAREKREICVYKSLNPKASLDTVGQHFEKEYGHRIGKSTIGDILRNKEKWLNISEDLASLSRSRPAKNEKLEEGLYLWLYDMNSRNEPVSDMMLIEKAKDIGTKLNVTDFAYSRGWLARFKSRHSVVKRNFEDESKSTDKTAEIKGKDKLKSVLSDYVDEDIFNIGVTGLLFKLGPTYTLASMSGVKCSKERITVALCTNATGTMKIKPFVISKTRRPRCFGKDFNPELYVKYRFNANAWMTSELFADWLISFDRQMKAENRHVILLCARHNSKKKLSNVNLHFLPPNTYIPPMDAGIIHAFKAYYRQFLLKHYIDCAERDVSQSLNLRQAIRIVKDAWNTVSPSTISKCYREVDIIDCNEDNDIEENDIPLAELRTVLKEVGLPDSDDIMTAEDYVNIDKEEVTGDQLTDDDIIKLVVKENESSDDEDVNDDDEPAWLDPTSHQAREYLEALLHFYENNGEMDKSNTISSLIRLVLEKKYNQQLMATKHIAVSTWLEAIGLIEYLPQFTQYVGVEDLLYLTESEIKDLGVHNGGHRAKIVSSLRILKEKYEKGRSYRSPDHSLNKPNQISSPHVQISPPSPLSHPDYSTVNVSPEKLQADLQRELHSDSSELKSHGWYHGNITRQHAEAIVKADGDFLVRDCISKPGDFVLTCCWHGVPLHFMINASVQEAERGALPKILYQFEEDSYPAIQNLIHHYLSKSKFVTQTSKAILKQPIPRSMPLSYYDSKYGALSSLSSAGAYTPTQSPRPSPFASPSGSPTNSPKMDRRRPYRTGSQPLLSVEELRDVPKNQFQSMDRSDSLPAINLPVSKHRRSPSRDRTVYNYHQRSGSEPVLMSETLNVPNTLKIGSGSDSDLSKPPPPKPSRIPSVKYKHRPKVQVRNIALYEDDGRDYSDYCQVKEEPSWLKGSNSQPVSPDATTPVCKSSPFDIYDNNFNNIKPNPLHSHELYGKALSNRNFPDLNSPQKEYSSQDIYNINNKYDNTFMKRRKITMPVVKSGMCYNLTGSNFNVLPNDCKPLEVGSMVRIKSILLENDPRILALHCTKTDLECVHVLSHEDFGIGVESGLELLTLPQGQQLRQDLIERCHCMKLLVIVSILTCSTISERAQMISQWIMVSQELKLLGNLFGFVNVMDGIMSPLVTRLKTTRLIVRQNHTNSAYILDTKLKTAYKSLNEGTSSLPLQNVCVPNINPLVYLLERDLETVLNELPWERINPIAGLEMFLTHLDTARVIAAQVELYQITGTAVMADFQGDTDILEVFDTRLHLNLLWGARGSSVNRVDRHGKFDQLLTILSERAEKTNDDGTAV